MVCAKSTPTDGDGQDAGRDADAAEDAGFREPERADPGDLSEVGSPFAALNSALKRPIVSAAIQSGASARRYVPRGTYPKTTAANTAIPASTSGGRISVVRKSPTNHAMAITSLSSGDTLPSGL